MIYNDIKEVLENPLFLRLLKGGIIPLSVLDYKVYYEYYTSQVNQGLNSEDAIISTCEEFNISKSTVNRARRLMTT